MMSKNNNTLKSAAYKLANNCFFDNFIMKHASLQEREKM